MAKKRRTPAQIRATKKLVAMNKKRARGGRSNPKAKPEWVIYAGDSPADPYAGPYTDHKKAASTLKWMKKNLFSPEGPSFFYMVKKPTRKNSAGPKKTLRSRAKAKRQLKRGRKATAAWVRSGMPSQRNRKPATCNPRKAPKERRIKVPKGWIQAKAVRVVRKGGKRIVEVRR
jgi:hypothetical protein